jgi:photosystem II stability/assembly factor-like uncharacterized protein
MGLVGINYIKPSEFNGLRSIRLALAVVVIVLAGLFVFASVLLQAQPPTISNKALQPVGSFSEIVFKERNSPTSSARSQAREAPMAAIGELVLAGHDIAWTQNYKGQLLSTRDDGRSWKPIGDDIPKAFDAFTFIDASRGWAVDDEGKIWKTDNGGYNWRTISQLKRQDPKEYYMGSSQVLFNGDSNGWVVDTFAVWRTSDGGLSWHEVEELSYRKSKNQVYRLYFLDSRVGWARCQGLILRTDDGGEHWHSIVETLSFDKFVTINALHFLDENHGWIAVSDAPKPYTENVVLFTEDGGKSWHPQSEISPEVRVHDIFFIDDKTGWMAGGKYVSDSGDEIGKLFGTQDGGHTWQLVNMPHGNDTFRSLHFTSADEGWLTTDYSVYHTRDGGKTWLTVLSFPEVKSRNLQTLGAVTRPS